MPIERNISSFIGSQFPEFYHEEGPNFIAFVTAYYKWMEEEGNALYGSRRIQDYQDVDRTIDDYLDKFKTQFIKGYPETLSSNAKFFIKKVLDLYRAKGTPRAYEVFFRAIYGIDVKLYMPGQDMLRLSDGRWNQPSYLEVQDSPILGDLEGKRIYGSGSGAEATVDSYIVKNINNKVLNLLYLSSVAGQFNTGEYVNVVGNTDISQAPRIAGSLVSMGLTDGGTDYSVGDIVSIVGKGGAGLAKVTSVRDQNGKVKFTLLDGGRGYTVNAEITVSGGGGNGATFAIGGLVDKSVVTLNTDVISDYLLVQLAAANYNFPKVNSPDIEDIATKLRDALTYVDVEIGTIQYLTRIHAGSGYVSDPTVDVYEPFIAPLQWDDGSGGIQGHDAVVLAEASSARGIATSMAVMESGFGYEPGERLEFSSNSNPTTMVAGAVVRNQGRGAGYWKDNSGFLNDSKYIQDSSYYQPFSYEVQVPLNLDKYQKLLFDLVHPAGMALFGKFLFVDEEASSVATLQQSSFTQA